MAAITALIVLGMQASPASACVCGIVAPATEQTAVVSQTEAILSWDGKTQRIDLSIDMDSEAAAAGLIFPTPHPATVTPGDEKQFEAVRDQTHARATVIDDWWGFGVEGESPRTEEPIVLDSVKIGSLTATTLEASDTSGLASWLKKNDYAIPRGSRAALAQYVEQGWSFVAVKLADGDEAGDGPLRGRLEPITFSFRSDELVYPLRMSAASSEPQDLRLYVFDEHRSVLAQEDSPSRPINAAQTVVWAGAVSGTKLSGFGDYLTVFDLHIDDPESQSHSDLVVAQDIADDVVLPAVVIANPITLFGIPVGLIVVGWGGFGLILGLAWVVSRLRLR